MLSAVVIPVSKARRAIYLYASIVALKSQRGIDILFAGFEVRMTENNNIDKRRDVRERVIGDVLWGYVSDCDEGLFEGGIVDESKNGLSIFTDQPLSEGQVLKIFSNDLWTGAKLATVKWCLEVARDTYRSGLLQVGPDKSL